jgi:hypothetical protein
VKTQADYDGELKIDSTNTTIGRLAHYPYRDFSNALDGCMI